MGLYLKHSCLELINKIQEEPDIKQELEARIATDAYSSYQYAKSINKRFLAGEVEIAKEAYWSYQYAANIIKGRFEIGEKVLSEDIDYAFWYAECVIRGRFILAEPLFFSNLSTAIHYAICVLKSKLPPHIHNKIILESLNKKSSNDIMDYVEFVKQLDIETK